MDHPNRASSSASSTNSASKYELPHTISELIRMFNIKEDKNFSKEAILELFEKNLNRQSKKPFSLFYDRLSNKPGFVEKYQTLKSQNIHEVDSFVRFLVRVREDKTVHEFLNNFKLERPAKYNINRYSLKSNQFESMASAEYNENLQMTPSSSNSSYRKSAKHRSSSSSALSTATKHSLTNSKKILCKDLNVPNLESPPTFDSKASSELNDSLSTNETSVQRCLNLTPTSSNATSNRKVPAYLSRDFHPLDWPKENDCFKTLGTLPVADQEQLLLRDLLFVLIGIEGRYIRLMKSENESRYKLILDPTTDHFLAVATNRILKISCYYSLIIAFVESRVYGLVIQALIASIQQHLYDYNMLICQMEDMLLRNDLFLQKMFFMLLPFFTTFRLLGEISYNLFKNRSVGGAVLTILHDKTKSIQGMDNNALELFLTLTKSSSVPYFDILKTWIYYGEIDDPRKEFFIEDTHNSATVLVNGSCLAPSLPANITNDNLDSDDDEYDDYFGKFNDKYWDLRYRVNPSKTPIFLKKHEQIIYKTGKYVSIINKVKQLFMKCSKVPPPLASHNSTSAPSSASENIKHSSHSFFWQSEKHSPNLAEGSFVSTSSSSSEICSQVSGPSAVIFTPKPEEIEYSFDESTYISPIVSAYEEASSQLLHILVHESQLVETFNAVKHYMLLSMGDFIVHFIKFASKDLCKRTDSVVQHRLDSMMGMALGISVCHSDRQFLKDDPHVEFVGKTFLKQIFQIMKPLSSSEIGFFHNDPSPSSSYLIRCDEDADDDEGDEDINLNRSIISSIIESPAAGGNEVDSKKLTKYINSGKSGVDKLDGNVITSQRTSQANNQNKVSNKLFCYESLMLKFDVPFPLSLIFTQKSIICYELLFRYVFLCRYAEMELEETWKDNILNIQLKKYDSLQLVNSEESSETDTETRLLAKAFKSIHKKAFALRYKMIAFVRNFHYFYAFEVVDPFFAQFISQITKKGSSLDSVIECHEKFLEHCFSSCFLTSIEITSIIIKIFTLCIELSHALKDSIDVNDQSSMMESSCFFNPETEARKSLQSSPKKSQDTIDGEFKSKSPFEPYIHEKLNKLYFSNRHYGKSVRTVKEIVEKANYNFDILVSKLLKKIYSDNCEYHMMYPFVARLDYNDFYRSKIIE